MAISKRIGILLLLLQAISVLVDSRRHHWYLKAPKHDPSLGEPPPPQWFDQKLDHFMPTRFRATWKQRFFVNDSFYSEEGPAFLMIGGEGPANPIWSQVGSWMQYAQSVGAVTFQLEHRYYGESHPTPNLSVKNMAYLSSEQALADIAYFITEMNKKYKITKWIAFGGSYPGSLASWLRYKYPHLVAGAVSTSGPVYAKSDFFEYLNVVDRVFKVTNAECAPAVQEGMHEVQRLLEHQVGMRVLSKMFKLCEPLNGTLSRDVSSFMESLIGNFEGVVQYNKDNRAFEGADDQDITIDTLCEIMSNETLGSRPIERLVEVNDLVLSRVEKTKCLDASYLHSIQEMSYHDWTGDSMRQWIYQTCTEFGWYQSSNQSGHPYSDFFPAKFFVDQCSDIFGQAFDDKLLNEGIQRTNILYGGKEPKGISNIVYVHGSFDPWHAMGITQDLSEDATAIFIIGTAHCANMYPESPEDPQQLKDARKKILALIQKWLQL
eukprot:TRINITY_DN3006_c0_g1_i1.p1 TRINITY_DN3006_c0_g1~~TRINITY_DN3006_c0_g1_i1.p1  ORF type:complete len:501 (-),score=82.80 TRINITY_DN3006_c0_g1_i1:279-1751(-)